MAEEKKQIIYKDCIPNFVKSQFTPCDLKIETKDKDLKFVVQYVPGIIDKLEGIYYINMVDECYYVSINSLIDGDPQDVIVPPGTYALEKWMDFAWLRSSTFYHMQYLSCEDWQEKYIMDLVVKINPIRIIMASLVERNGDIINILWKAYKNSLLQDSKSTMLMTVGNYISFYPDDARYFSKKFGISKLKFPLLTLIDVGKILRTIDFATYDMFDLINLILQNMDPKEVQSIIDRELGVTLKKSKAWWLLNEGANYRLLYDYISVAHNVEFCLDELREIKMFFELRPAIALPRTVISIVTSYLPWYNVVDFTHTQRFYLENMRWMMNEMEMSRRENK